MTTEVLGKCVCGDLEAEHMPLLSSTPELDVHGGRCRRCACLRFTFTAKGEIT